MTLTVISVIISISRLLQLLLATLALRMLLVLLVLRLSVVAGVNHLQVLDEDGLLVGLPPLRQDLLSLVLQQSLCLVVVKLVQNLRDVDY